MKKDLIIINSKDNVGVLLSAYNDIPAGHKIALKDIKKDEPVIKYGMVIGKALKDIKKDEWVHTHNLITHLDEEVSYSYKFNCDSFEKRYMTFKGYVREDGRVGIRNDIYIIPTVGCVNSICKMIEQESQQYIKGSIDSIVTLTHQFGCSQLGEDNENIKNVYECYAHNSIEKCLKDLEKNLNDLCETSIKLLDSTLIEPGVYDIITAPAITGLIAHEAFGHGVELDMFLKNRAKAKNYIDEYVASPLITMHDGASACLSQASYFFDDDGVLAQDTIIIEKGILKRGISDLVSAMELGNNPTGNGRRQNPFHKSYSRMTNTFFEAGESKKNDMIKSIKHGYLLCQMDNGMEDPKNWNIQCTCAYAKEIVDGKFSGKIVAPVVMSGNVLDLLKSITAVSKEFEIHGSGHCGKGHKEWVPVSDGGPYLKARCKLG